MLLEPFAQFVGKALQRIGHESILVDRGAEQAIGKILIEPIRGQHLDGLHAPAISANPAARMLIQRMRTLLCAVSLTGFPAQVYSRRH